MNSFDSILSSSESISSVSSECSRDVSVYLDELQSDNDARSETSIEINRGTNIMSFNINKLHPSDDGEYQHEHSRFRKSLHTKTIRTTTELPDKPYVQSVSHSETIIDGDTYRWPTFEIKNTFFKGKSTKTIQYLFQNNCS